MSNDLVVAVLLDDAQAVYGLGEALPASAYKFEVAIDKMTQKNIANMDRQLAKLNQLRAELIAASKSPVGLGSAGSRAAVDASLLKTEKQLAALGQMPLTIGKSLDALASKAVSVGATMSKAFTLPVLAVAGVAAKMFVDFQRNMEMLHTQAGASQAEVAKQTRNILDYAKSGVSPASPLDLAKGIYYTESRGFRGQQAFNITKMSAQAAGMGIAPVMDVDNAIGGAVLAYESANQAYAKIIPTQKGVAQTMGIVNAIVGQGAMHMADFTAALKTGVGPAASAAGITLKELGAALAVMTDRGIPAQMGATRLRMTFAMMQKPTQAAVEALADLGIKQSQLADLMKSGPTGFLKALELLQAGIDRSSDKTKAYGDVLQAFGKGRSSAGILTLLNSLASETSSYQGKLAAIDRQQGDFMKALAAYHQTASYKISAAWNSIKASMIIAGAAVAPIVVVMANGLKSLVQGFQNLSGPVKAFIGALILVPAVLGPVLFIGGKLWKVWRDIGVMLDSVAGLFRTTSTTIIAGEEAVAASAEAANAEIGPGTAAAATEASTAVSASMARISAEYDAEIVQVEAFNVAVGQGTVTAAAAGATGLETAMAADTAAISTAEVAASTLSATLLGIAGLGVITVVIAEILTQKDNYTKTPQKGSSMSQIGRSIFQDSAGNFYRQQFIGKGGTEMVPITRAQAIAAGAILSSATHGPGAGHTNVPASAAELINQYAGQYGVDPNAATAIAQVEGLSGKPGDYGRGAGQSFVPLKPGTPGGYYTSFGPFQLHAGGELPAEIWAKGPEYAQAWANSPAGIKYALAAIGKKAGGLKGNAAMAAISAWENPGAPTRDLINAGGQVPAVTGANNPMANSLYPSVDIAAQKAAAKAAAAARAAGNAAAKAIIDPINKTLSVLKTAVSSGLKEKASPTKIEANIRKEISQYSDDIDKVKDAMKTKNATERAKLGTELTKLKNGLSAAKAQLSSEIQTAALDVLKATSTKDNNQYTKFSANLDALQKLGQYQIPGLTTDFLQQSTDFLNKEVKVLNSELAPLKAQLNGKSTAFQTALQSQIAKLNDDLAQVNGQIEQDLQTKISNLKSAYDTAMQNFNQVFTELEQDVKQQFADQTQDYINNVISPRFFQGPGQQTPEEAALKAAQDAATAASQQKAIADARTQFITDVSAGADLTTILNDRDAIQNAQDAVTLQGLENAATASRVAADTAYAAATKEYTDQRQIESLQLGLSLNQLQTAVDKGTKSLSDVDKILGQYGITLTGVDLATYQVDYAAAHDALVGDGGLVPATTDLQNAFQALVDWINKTTGLNIKTNITPNPNSGGGDLSTITIGNNVYQQMAGGGLALISGDPRDAQMLAQQTHQAIAMASGGIVNRPTYAMVGEAGPEAVIPLSSMHGMGTAIHIHFDGPIIGNDLERAARQIAPAIRAEFQRTQRRNAAPGYS